MTDLQMFLLENTINDLTKEVVISERLKDKPFTISCIDGVKLNEYQKQCMKVGAKGKREFDTQKFNETIVLNHCVNPNFRDAEWLAKAGCPTNPKALLYKILTGGEVINLAIAIQQFSGFGEVEQEEMVEEVKNS